MTRCRMILVLAILFGTSGELSAQRRQIDKTAIDQLFVDYDNLDSPGCSVGIVVEGELVFARGYGAASLEHRVPNGSQTTFEIGSFTKGFTSLCIAMLLDEGLVSPESDIREFLPEMPEYETPIRVRHLVQCRTGLWAQFHLMPLAGWDNLPIQSPHTQEDVLTLVRAQPSLPFEPGSEFRYGSTDYLLLGEIVRSVTGLPLAEFADQRVFEPLGMSHTFFEVDPSLVVPHRATCYYEGEDGESRQWKNHGYFVGGSGVLTSVADLACFDRAFLDSPFPSGEYVDHFLATGTLLDNRNCLDALPKDEYRGLRRMQFTGGVFGAASAMLRFPDERIAFICLSNTDEIKPWIMCERMADVVLGGEMDPVSPELTETLDTLAAEAAVELTEEELAAFTGTYRAVDAHLTWRCEVDDGKLVLIDHTHRRHPLEAVGATKFRPIEPTPFEETARLTFHRQGAVDGWTLDESWYVSENLRSTEFHPVTLAAPTPEQLQEYVGVYESQPLNIDYSIRAEGDALWLRVGSRHWEQLDPLLEDEFIPHIRTRHDQRVFRFERDEASRVTGMFVSFWRIRDMPFARRD